MSYEELYDYMQSAEMRFGVIVYSQDNWEKEYPIESRSYVVCNCDWGWQHDKISNAKYGTSLDYEDRGVRLDYYDWKIESCRIMTTEEYEQWAGDVTPSSANEYSQNK